MREGSKLAELKLVFEQKLLLLGYLQHLTLCRRGQAVRKTGSPPRTRNGRAVRRGICWRGRVCVCVFRGICVVGGLESQIFSRNMSHQHIFTLFRVPLHCKRSQIFWR